MVPVSHHPGRKERTGRPVDDELTARILEVGTELLNRNGFAAFNVEEVARQAGCGKAAIYRRYPRKAALAAAIIESHAVIGELPNSGSLREDLLAHALQNQSNQEGFDFSSGHGMQAIFEPEVYPLVRDSLIRRRRERGRALIARGIERGELGANVEPDIILDTLAGLTMYRQMVKGTQIDPRHYLDVIDALLAQPPRSIAGDEGEH
ncbi:DNA-binding transcriptional regulator, AcrR family [Propionibacterium cyclohexanicum]|uniref:DNA-binding transcriptional regulator, AcrR family n=2 Tax=Propionibacterium cyclohexanicum TaxID=64702 RepID=A0A1H9U0D4_9ACTN|nr:DNA-binding transcriptional regulator, AcrR family [Propionibacterium cyclohexanicum]